LKLRLTRYKNNFKIIENNNQVHMEPERQRSNWWYLVPIFLGIIGGIIAYFALRKDDHKKAKKCLYIGLVLFAIGIIVDLAVLTSGIAEEQFGMPGY